MLCSFFFFLEALTCLCTTDCLGSEIFCLELEFSSPGVYIHTSHPVLLCCGNPSRTEQCPYACRDTLFTPGKETAALLPLAPACSSVASAGRALLPFLPLHQADTTSQTLTPVVRICVGWGGANYPVLTRVRPVRALALHTDAFPASCAG